MARATWTDGASLLFSISILSWAFGTASGPVQLASAGNPKAIESSLLGFIAGMDGIAVPNVMAEATGRAATAQTAPRLERDKEWVLSQGKALAYPAALAGPLGITDGRSDYQVKVKSWLDDNDSTHHIIAVGTDENPSIILVFKPANNSYAISWRTDVTGKLISTVYSDGSSNRVVPNETYAEQFQAQIVYWDAIVPVPPTVRGR